MEEQEVVELRRELKTCTRGPGSRLPEELRGRAAAFALQWLATGRTYKDAADALGVSVSSVRRWQVKALASQVGPLVPLPVEIVASSAAGTHPTARLRLTSPDGYHVDDLSVAEAAALLRALR